MWPFKENAEKAAANSAAQVESDRLVKLPIADLAVEVMAAFGPAGVGIKSGHQLGALQIGTWLLSGFSTASKYRQPIFGATIEALGILENANLVQGRNFGSGKAKTYQATRAGQQALEDGTVRALLG